MGLKFSSLAVIASFCMLINTVWAKPTNKKSHRATKQRQLSLKSNAGIDHYRYVAGGMLSLIPGFGIGHAVQGRWSDGYGWLFTVGEGLTLLGAGLSIMMTGIFCVDDDDSQGGCSDPKTDKWLTAFLVLKLGEAVSAWYPPKLMDIRDRRTRRNLKIIPHSRYITGGTLGTVVGFGVGHAVQGRWWHESGWAYTLTQLPAVPAIIAKRKIEKCKAQVVFEKHAWKCNSYYMNDNTAILLITMYVISRIIEVISIWDINHSLYRVVDADKRSALRVLPYADAHSFGLQLAFSH